ncbi:MAG TPA: S9 family peptidase [Usitatibacter sp.]|nr:S9 family peptidase [Usitatibacter sp.]
MKPFETEDFHLFEALDDLACSKAHDVAAMVVQSVDREADGYRSSIWIADMVSGASKRFTSEASGASSPAWSPDGRTLAFLSARAASVQQVYLIDRDGGEARQLGFCPSGAVGVDWSPAGDRLLVTCPVYVDPDSREASVARDEPWPSDAPEICWCLPYKSDSIGYILNRGIHLFVMDAHTGVLRQLTWGPFDVLGAAWSRDGRRVAYIRTVEAGQAHRTDLWTLDVGTGEHRRLTTEIATVQQPLWSPDGRFLAFAGAQVDGDPQARMWLVDTTDGSIRQVGHDDIEVVGDLHWSNDGERLIFVEAHRSCHRIVSLSPKDGSWRVLVERQRQISNLTCTRTGFAFFAESIDMPGELYVTDEKGGSERRVTDFNAWWRERTPVEVELRSFRVPDGKGGEESIDGWYVRPRGAPGPLPLMVEAHGGPTSYAMLGYRWHTHWYVLASRGWSILALNPVGSSGYGRDFAARLNGHWGEIDFPQHEAAVRALQAGGLADDRVAISGKSYGGYMSAWAIGHSRLFRAAIVSAPVVNLESHFGTSDGGYYYDPYTMQGERHMNADRFRTLSPMHSAHLARTPTLILQGKDDQRCPRGQAEELFASLMRCADATTEMVLYPGGDHHFYEQGKPSHRLDVVTRSIGWLERWINQEVEQVEETADTRLSA